MRPRSASSGHPSRAPNLQRIPLERPPAILANAASSSATRWTFREGGGGYAQSSAHVHWRGSHGFSSPSISATGSRCCRPACSLTRRLGATTPNESRRGRSGGDGAASNMAKHRLARSRSGYLQKARDRYDPAGHCGRRSGGSGRSHSRRLGIRPYRIGAGRGRSAQGSGHRHRGDADNGFPQVLRHDPKGDHSTGAARRKESRNT